MGKAEQKKIKNNAKAIKRYEGDENLAKHRFQVHILTIEHGDGKTVSCKSRNT